MLPPDENYEYPVDFDSLRNIESLVVPLSNNQQLFNIPSLPKLLEVVFVSDRKWPLGHEQEEYDDIFRHFLENLQSKTSKLKSIYFLVPKFCEHAWELFHWSSQVWHSHFSRRGVKLYDQCSLLESPGIVWHSRISIP